MLRQADHVETGTDKINFHKLVKSYLLYVAVS